MRLAVDSERGRACRAEGSGWLEDEAIFWDTLDEPYLVKVYRHLLWPCVVFLVFLNTAISDTIFFSNLF